MLLMPERPSKVTRLERSRSLRDTALKILRKDGFWRQIGGLDGPFLSFEGAELRMIYVSTISETARAI